MENRQQTGFDASLPGPGLLVWHVDESISGNTNELHPKVALMQADGKRDLEQDHNRGDAGDPYPGSSGNTAFTNASTPNSQSYANASTCVSITGISASAAVMTANVQVKCKTIKETKEAAKDTKDTHKETKELAKEAKDTRKEVKETAKDVTKDKELAKEAHKDTKEIATEKPPVDKQVEKPLTDKGAGLDKPVDVPGGGFGQPAGSTIETSLASLESRLTQVERLLGQMATTVTGTAHPAIAREHRPDLSKGALTGEADYGKDSDAGGGPAAAKRHLDKGSDH
jgi:immune inhibitor A